MKKNKGNKEESGTGFVIKVKTKNKHKGYVCIIKHTKVTFLFKSWRKRIKKVSLGRINLKAYFAWDRKHQGKGDDNVLAKHKHVYCVNILCVWNEDSVVKG